LSTSAYQFVKPQLVKPQRPARRRTVPSGHNRIPMLARRQHAMGRVDTQRHVRAIGRKGSFVGLSRYAARAYMERQLADMLEDELRALEGGHWRKIALDDRGMFPGTD
jgi:hypothetical protein